MTTIRMPQLGETIVEGTILKWLKKEGDAIERDEPLFEISTDKVDTEVPSSVGGTVTKILVEEGQTVPVGTDLAEVSEEGASGGDGAAASGAAEVAAPEAARRESRTQRRAPRRSPKAPPPRCPPSSRQPPREPRRPPHVRPHLRAAARATSPTEGRGRGSCPRSCAGSPTSTASTCRRSRGPGRADGSRRRTSWRRSRVVARPPRRPPPRSRLRHPPPAPAAAPQAAPQVAPAVTGPGDEVVPVSHIRKLIGQHMVASLQTSARAWTMVEVNVDHLVKLRERAKESFKTKHGVSLTYLPFVIRATCDALMAHPEVNSSLRGDEIVRHRAVHMGIAVSYDEGLIVPVIKGADAMNTVGLARAIADLAARARAHQLKPDEIQGSTFTITNPGPYGSVASVPIINQPNTGILSLDAIQKRAVVIEDTIAIRSMVNISMSWDHRTIDGEIATRFLARVKQNLESWDFAEDVTV